MDKDRLLLDYLKALLDRYGKYHDHKEVSTWAGVVLYFAFGAAVLNAEVSKPISVLEFSIVSGAILLAAVLATLLIRKQLKLKDVAGSYAGAATYFMTELLTTGQLKEPLTAIAQSTDTEMQSSHVLS